MATKPGGAPERSATHGPEPREPGNADNVASTFDDDDDAVGDKGQLGELSVWARVKQHLRRRWWIYLISIVILLAILLPIL